jgi:cytochrome P450
VLWTRRYPEFTAAARERHGPTYTVRIGGMPTSVVTVDRDAIRRLFTGDPLMKRHGNDILRSTLGDRSVLLLEPDEHLERRKLLLPPFHGERVRGYARLMEHLIAAELGRWRSREVVAVLPRAQNLTLEVILQAVLGMRDEEMRGRLRAIYDSMIGITGSALGFYFPQTHRRWNPAMRSFLGKKAALDAILTEQIAATRDDPALGERDDILAMLVSARDEHGNGLTTADLLSELNTLLVAGHETTATAIAWGAELLAHHPEELARARDGDERHLDAVVKEILRSRPPIPIGGARQPVEPFPIDGFTIDPSVVILVDGWGVHHDPDVYPDPDAFRPERFLDEPPDSYAFLPFGGGAHRCIGAALAQLEIKVVLSALLERYDLAPTQDEIAPPVRRAIALVPRGGGRVRVTARTRALAAT